MARILHQHKGNDQLFWLVFYSSVMGRHEFVMFVLSAREVPVPCSPTTPLALAPNSR